MPLTLIRLLAVAAVLGRALPAPAQPLTVAAASDLQFVMPALAAQFEKETGHKVQVTFGSSGNFFTQIQNGAPFDAFLSADVDYPRRLEAGGLAARGTVRTYATGRLALWVRRESALDVSRGLAALGDAAVKRVAIANPAHAPYGRAAVAALEGAGLYAAVRDKLVFGENVSQAAQFARSGNADAAIVALSLALSQPMKDSGRYREVPPDLHPPIEQGAAVMAASKQRAIATRFVDYLRQPAAAALFRSFGFSMPAGDPR